MLPLPKLIAGLALLAATACSSTPTGVFSGGLRGKSISGLYVPPPLHAESIPTSLSFARECIVTFQRNIGHLLSFVEPMGHVDIGRVNEALGIDESLRIPLPPNFDMYRVDEEGMAIKEDYYQARLSQIDAFSQYRDPTGGKAARLVEAMTTGISTEFSPDQLESARVACNQAIAHFADVFGASVSAGYLLISEELPFTRDNASADCRLTDGRYIRLGGEPPVGDHICWETLGQVGEGRTFIDLQKENYFLAKIEVDGRNFLIDVFEHTYLPVNWRFFPPRGKRNAAWLVAHGLLVRAMSEPYLPRIRKFRQIGPESKSHVAFEMIAAIEQRVVSPREFSFAEEARTTDCMVELHFDGQKRDGYARRRLLAVCPFPWDADPAGPEQVNDVMKSIEFVEPSPEIAIDGGALFSPG